MYASQVILQPYDLAEGTERESRMLLRYSIVFWSSKNSCKRAPVLSITAFPYTKQDIARCCVKNVYCCLRRRKTSRPEVYLALWLQGDCGLFTWANMLWVLPLLYLELYMLSMLSHISKYLALRTGNKSKHALDMPVTMQGRVKVSLVGCFGKFACNR